MNSCMTMCEKAREAKRDVVEKSHDSWCRSAFNGSLNANDSSMDPWA